MDPTIQDPIKEGHVARNMIKTILLQIFVTGGKSFRWRGICLWILRGREEKVGGAGNIASGAGSEEGKGVCVGGEGCTEIQRTDC